jgi:hypothetical protein
MVFDPDGEPMVASHACKGKVRYRYYVSRTRQHKAEGVEAGIRMSAPELEKAVVAQLAALFDDPLALADRTAFNVTPAQMAIRVNFLAPKVMDAILAGDQAATLDARGLLGLTELPLSWAAQVRQLLPS